MKRLNMHSSRLSFLFLIFWVGEGGAGWGGGDLLGYFFLLLMSSHQVPQEVHLTNIN